MFQKWKRRDVTIETRDGSHAHQLATRSQYCGILFMTPRSLSSDDKSTLKKTAPFFLKGKFGYFFKLKKSFAGIHRREKNQRSIYQIARPFSGMNYWSSLYANI